MPMPMAITGATGHWPGAPVKAAQMASNTLGNEL
ncbi:hypothetical protein ANO14919_009970 [Xylariales sp. No.14919]|nr:hypothetical protein ANO14919_009970 [Xylariales sp. No.14919]